jgi:excisionase family DNA binding protein
MTTLPPDDELPVARIQTAILGADGSSPAAAKRRRTDNAWLSPRQVARRFGVGTSAIYGAVKRGELPAIRLGRHIRISHS